MKNVRLVFFVYLILLTTTALFPSVEMNKLQTAGFELRIDYFLHTIAFLLLSVLLLGWQLEIGKEQNSKRLFLLFLIVALFSIILEFSQQLIPGRTFNLYDILFNTIGILSGFAIFALYKKIKLN